MTGAFAEVVLAARTARATVDPAHARLLCEGHFPGDPLVPGAYLAGLMADLGARLVQAEPVEVVRCAFLAPVRPGQPIEVRASAGDGRVDAEVWAGGTCAARAQLRFATR